MVEQLGMRDRLESGSTDTTQPISYRRCDLGLSNQKFALLGLFFRAHQEKRPVILPPMTVFKTATENDELVPFHHAFSRASIEKFAAAYDIDIIEDPAADYDDIGGWSAFQAGAERLGIDMQRGESSLNNFIGHFYQSLNPAITQSRIFKKLRSAVFDDLKIELTSQMRIETDWLEYSERRSASTGAPLDSYIPSFQSILKKIDHSFAFKAKRIYVVCDETRLPVTKEEIRKTVVKDYGISLFWKSDILSEEELQSLSLLDMSIIDFEMAVYSPAYVGLSDSGLTFLAWYEKFVRTRSLPEQHYVHNNEGEFLQARCDKGSQFSAAGVADKIHARTALIPPMVEDCFWPLELTAHISNLGDFATIATSVCGIKGGALVCGSAGDETRRIEGFKIEMVGQAPCGIEYKAILENGEATPWAAPGSYVGTIGQAQALTGFAVRLVGKLAGRFQCLSACAFAGTPEIRLAANGEDCTAGGAKLEAMQIIIRPVSFWEGASDQVQ